MTSMHKAFKATGNMGKQLAVQKMQFFLQFLNDWGLLRQ